MNEQELHDDCYCHYGVHSRTEAATRLALLGLGLAGAVVLIKGLQLAAAAVSNLLHLIGNALTSTLLVDVVMSILAGLLALVLLIWAASDLAWIIQGEKTWYPVKWCRVIAQAVKVRIMERDIKARAAEQSVDLSQVTLADVVELSGHHTAEEQSQLNPEDLVAFAIAFLRANGVAHTMKQIDITRETEQFTADVMRMLETEPEPANA